MAITMLKKKTTHRCSAEGRHSRLTIINKKRQRPALHIQWRREISFKERTQLERNKLFGFSVHSVNDFQDPCSGHLSPSACHATVALQSIHNILCVQQRWRRLSAIIHDTSCPPKTLSIMLWLHHTALQISQSVTCLNTLNCASHDQKHVDVKSPQLFPNKTILREPKFDPPHQAFCRPMQYGVSVQGLCM